MPFTRNSNGGFLQGSAGGLDLTSGGTITGDLSVTGAVTAGTGIVLSAGKLNVPAGTAALPSIIFNSVTDCGLSSPSGVLSLSRGGTAGASLDSTGSFRTKNVVGISEFGAYNVGELRQTRIVTKTANYTVLNTDAVVVMNNTGLTATLPAAPKSDQMVFIRNLDAGNLTIGRNGKNIDGAAADLTVATGVGVLLQYDGTSWTRLI